MTLCHPVSITSAINWGFIVQAIAFIPCLCLVSCINFINDNDGNSCIRILKTLFKASRLSSFFIPMSMTIYLLEFTYYNTCDESPEKWYMNTKYIGISIVFWIIAFIARVFILIIDVTVKHQEFDSRFVAFCIIFVKKGATYATVGIVSQQVFVGYYYSDEHCYCNIDGQERIMYWSLVTILSAAIIVIMTAMSRDWGGNCCAGALLIYFVVSVFIVFWWQLNKLWKNSLTFDGSNIVFTWETVGEAINIMLNVLTMIMPGNHEISGTINYVNMATLNT